MSHFKSPDNLLHFLDDDSFAYLLPEGSVPITDEEAAAIAEAAKPPAPSASDITKAEIVRLEQSQLMPRATREFMLLSMEAQFTAEQLVVNPGYVAVKAFDEQIKALRDKL